MKIKWLKPHPGFSYFVNDICEMPEKRAKKLVKSGHVETYKEPKPEIPAIDLPDDIPGRDALIAHGIETLAEAQKIKDFTEINGIGKSLNNQLQEYFASH